MRIAIPYEDGVVCQHFGKAPQFKIFDVQPQGVVESVVIDSEASGHEALAEFLAAQGVQAVICGGIGQGALVSLAQSGIDVLPGVTGNPWKYSKIVMISLSDKEALRRLRFTPSSPKSNFPAFSASKTL